MYWYNEYMSTNHATYPPTRQRAAASDAEPISRRKLSHEVLDRLLGRIRAGDYPVGSWMPSERELMQSFGVGRPAVREAMQSLQRMGLVDIVHGEGARVLAVTADSVIAQISDSALHLLTGSPGLLEDLKHARLHFEVSMVRLAAQNASAADIERLRLVLDEHRKSLPDRQRFLETDMAFHRAIAALSGNTVYRAVSQAMLQWLEKFHHELVRAPGAEKGTLAEHEELFERIAAHDPEGAARVMTAHLTRAQQHYHTGGGKPAVPAAPKRKTR
jgi:DNA-binding FadR family transcriptional regulator